LAKTIAVVGAGAWGTAVAVHLARASGRTTMLWARDPAQAAAMAAARVNARYLPGVALPESLTVTARLDALAEAELMIAAPPIAALPLLARELLGAGVRAPLAWLSKGLLEAPALPGGVALPHQVLGPLWPTPVGVISGPSFAEEVAAGLPTALTVAATATPFAALLAERFRGDALRAYESDDIAGVEIGGAVKNVLAIAAGASDGLGFGSNARAALVTRGLAETMRLAAALGGRRETLMGLAGLGDLVLTCTGDLSRNRRVGLALAAGRRLPEILGELGHVAEGVAAAVRVRALARHFGVDMPIADAVYRTLHEGLPVRDAVLALLRREPRPERH
jgi:glycerol-3-phosphate dehydrogenase (NAD(P)+)